MASIESIPISRIRPGRNDRQTFEEEALTGLAHSIASDGLAQPIVVRRVKRDRAGTDLEIVAGERRFRACRDVLKLDAIDAIVRDLDDLSASNLMLAENVQRENLNPMEEAEAYRRRIDDFGYDVAELAAAIGVAPRRITKRLGFLTLGPEAQHWIRTEQMSPGFAQQMVGLDGNRQHLAIAAFQNDPRMIWRQFAALCDKLRAEQDQDSLFDPNDVLQIETYVLDAVQNGKRRLSRAQLVELVEQLLHLVDESEPAAIRARAALDREAAAARH